MHRTVAGLILTIEELDRVTAVDVAPEVIRGMHTYRKMMSRTRELPRICEIIRNLEKGQVSEYDVEFVNQALTRVGCQALLQL
jgi:hypothetical protein